MPLKWTVVEKTSKQGNPNTVLRVELGNNVKKDVFLNDAEIAILQLNSQNS